MKSFWDDINKTYDLNIGEEKLSPILRCSAGLSLKYISDLKDGKIEAPFCLCFPEKFQSAIWLSLSVLRNFFLDDYVFQSSNRLTQLGLRKGDNVEIFNCTARYIGHDGKFIKLGFRDAQSKRPISLISQLNKTDVRRLNTIDQFRRSQRELKKNRNAVSRIIEPKENILINTGMLDSKVLLVTGRGNLSKVKKTLSEILVYDEPIGQAFGLETNLLLTPDLEPFKNQFDPGFLARSEVFRTFFLASYEQLKPVISASSLFEEFNTLKELVEKNEFHTAEFKESYESILEEMDQGEFPALFNVSEKYPGVCEPLPSKIQAVILNDISLFDSYGQTISGLIKEKIPVIIVCDKSISFDGDINFFRTLFKKYPEIRRIDWTKDKIKVLAEFDSNEKYLDQNLWIKSKRYSNQKIRIEKFDPHPLDPILLRFQNLLVSLDGYENLKQAYWNLYYPAVYAIKNDPSPNSEIVNDLLNRFTNSIRELRQHLSKEANDLMTLAVVTAQRNIVNSKKFGNDETVFLQELGVFDGVRFSIPAVYPGRGVFEVSDDLEEITFPGFPLNEPINSVLINSIHIQFVPLVRILAWPEESSLIYQYIYRRLMGGYCGDNGITQFGFPAGLLLETAESIQSDLKSTLDYSPEVQFSEAKQEKAEGALLTLSKTRINIYNRASETGVYSVKCNIIYLEHECFMFLPYTSKVLAQTETSGGSIKIKRALFPELKTGYKIFSYKLDRTDRRELLKEMLSSAAVLDDLHIWKNHLDKMVKDLDENIDLLEKKLNDVKTQIGLPGNPSRINIYRWLYDDELLAPYDENLRIILAASGQGNNDSDLKKIREAYRQVNALNIRIASQIKKHITAELKKVQNENQEEFFVKLGKMRIEILSRKITSVQKDSFDVDYSNTRKFLN